MLFRVGFVVAVAVSLAMPAHACEATKSAYDRLKLQMTPDQVNEIVGCAGDLVRESEAKDLVIQGYEWKGPRGGILDISFDNGKLATKSQSSLR